jgi:hypothetical protein
VEVGTAKGGTGLRFWNYCECTGAVFERERSFLFGSSRVRQRYSTGKEGHVTRVMSRFTHTHFPVEFKTIIYIQTLLSLFC